MTNSEYWQNVYNNKRYAYYTSGKDSIPCYLTGKQEVKVRPKEKERRVQIKGNFLTGDAFRYVNPGNLWN